MQFTDNIILSQSNIKYYRIIVEIQPQREQRLNRAIPTLGR